jgi:hypothetical protein
MLDKRAEPWHALLQVVETYYNKPTSSHVGARAESKLPREMRLVPRRKTHAGWRDDIQSEL